MYCGLWPRCPGCAHAQFGLPLRAAGAHLPATMATAIGGAALVTGEPFLMRKLREIMLGNRAGRVW